jgi:hypothetical protein
MIFSRLLPAVAAFFISTVPATALTLECNITKSSAGGGYITDIYYFDYDEAKGKALVADGLIFHFNNDQPMAAKVSEDSNKKLVFTWAVRITTDTGQTANMQFRASYFKGDKTVLVRAVPGGDYSNNFESRGKCKAV